MDIQGHLEGLRQAMVAFVRYVERAGLRADVPTTPEWRTRKLIAHQGLVHRWAAAQLRGTPIDEARVEAEGMNHDDPLDWLREGSLELVTALVAKQVSPDAAVFLADAPPAREFWARRQCHETTVHAVDALGASLGRVPTAADVTWVTEGVALDGLDELLTGFLPRPGQRRLVVERPVRYLVVPEGADRGWALDLSAGPAVTTRLSGEALATADGDAVLRAPAVSAYLSLWNRNADPLPSGWEDWPERVRPRWS